MKPIAVTAIQAMVAPVVLITAAAILTGAAGALLSAADVPPDGRERLTQIDTQLPCFFAGSVCCTMPFFSSTPRWLCWC